MASTSSLWRKRCLGTIASTVTLVVVLLSCFLTERCGAERAGAGQAFGSLGMAQGAKLPAPIPQKSTPQKPPPKSPPPVSKQPASKQPASKQSVAKQVARELRAAFQELSKAPTFRVVSRCRAGRSKTADYSIERAAVFHYAAANVTGNLLFYPDLQAYRGLDGGVHYRKDAWLPLPTSVEGRWVEQLHPHPRRAVARWIRAGGSGTWIDAPTQEWGKIDEAVEPPATPLVYARVPLSKAEVRSSYARIIRSGVVTQGDESVSPWLDSVDQTRLTGFVEYSWEKAKEAQRPVLRAVDVYLTAPLGGSLRDPGGPKKKPGEETTERIVVQFQLLYTQRRGVAKFEVPAAARRAWR